MDGNHVRLLIAFPELAESVEKLLNSVIEAMVNKDTGSVSLEVRVDNGRLPHTKITVASTSKCQPSRSNEKHKR